VSDSGDGAARARTVRRLEESTGQLATAAIARMEQALPWYRAMPAENRSWVGLVAQAGIAAFVAWFAQPDEAPAITADVFGTAPRELTRAVTLQQTVELVRATIGVVEEHIEELAEPAQAATLREGVLRYSREIAFAAAQVYAQAAESRGAWDARLEALVVDALLRGDADEAVRSRAAALGWGTPAWVAVVLGAAPEGDPELVVEAVRRVARHAGLEVLTGVQGDRLVAVIGGDGSPTKAAEAIAAAYAPGAVVLGPPVQDLVSATVSAQAAVAALRAAPAWPAAPRPVAADELLAERAMAGDDSARNRLVAEVYLPLRQAGTALLDTVTVYLAQAASLEGTARLLFVHPNTVRYRLRRVAEVTGYAPGDPREAFVLQVALALGRLEGSDRVSEL